MPHHRPCWSAWHIPHKKCLAGGLPPKRELQEPGRPQGIAPAIHGLGKPTRGIVGAIPCGRPCAPTSGLSEGCPHHPRTGASPALRLHELGGLIRRRVGLTLAVNLGVGRGPLKLVPIGDPLRSPLRRGLIPNTLCQLPTSIAYISPYTSISRSFVILLNC